MPKSKTRRRARRNGAQRATATPATPPRRGQLRHWFTHPPTLAAISWISLTLGLAGLWLTAGPLSPSIGMSASGSLNPSDPFQPTIAVINNGFWGAHHLQFGCSGALKLLSDRPLGMARASVANDATREAGSNMRQVDRLERQESVTKTCPARVRIDGTHPVAGTSIDFAVRYRYGPFGLLRGATATRFVSREQGGTIVWVPDKSDLLQRMPP